MASKNRNKSDAVRQKWDDRYGRDGLVYQEPVAFLRDHVHLLPKRGKALDVAAGAGRNGIYLAEVGYEVDLVDVSAVGLQKAQDMASQRQVRISTIVADLNELALPEEEYDLIVSFYYLQRDLIPRLKRALKPNGVIVFETFTIEQLTLKQAKKMRRAYLLEKEELKKLFADFSIVTYRETIRNHKAVASIIARKRSAETPFEDRFLGSLSFC
ncbi:MAG: class I SAM-dependent methyltransferase [Ardenticatenaceae bacterium]